MVGLRGKFAAVIVAGGVLVAGVGCSSSDDDSSSKAPAKSSKTAQAESFKAVAFSGAPDGFYTPPQPLPDVAHGTLLRYEKLDAKVDGGTAYRIMYASESVKGDPIAVTGEVAVPDGAAPAGGWKLVSIAHGTTGIADDCAPSKDSGNSYLAFAGAAVKGGYAVTITDYEGLGTPGVHPYLVGVSEGRGVVDAALAIRQLPGTKIGTRYAIWGYSQGGQAAAWANQIAAKWAPSLDLLGTVAGAPPSEMKLIFNATGQSIPGFFFMIVAGYHAAYPDADPSKILTPAGMKVLAQADKNCGAIGTAVGSQPMSTLVKPGFSQDPTWGKILDENDVGKIAVKSPLLILHSGQDDLVPAILSEAMFKRMCTHDQVVERRVYNKGQGHGGAVPDAVKDGMAWIGERFAGTPAKSTCP